MPVKIDCRITDTAFDPAAELAHFRNIAGDAGGIASFIGQVRGHGDGVLSLELQHYPAMTLPAIRDMADCAATRWDLTAVTIIHRVGVMHPGDAIVAVYTAASHRRAAFEACDYLMDYLKSRAPFWKRETTAQGSTWIEPRSEDYSDAERWSITETCLPRR